ncbi:hypothetical protein SKAU_G00199820 [Synaphobranchus kaupii]|uniref:SMB domain-containing protein n=1 Tax=Synaphobranchus kaupii TaxID=118154 RepID=A0A9Q1IY32_SYNKA|nr:hypothetical protein SKAU_G00199820 [Synaphobranchus kaupii]
MSTTDEGNTLVCKDDIGKLTGVLFVKLIQAVTMAGSSILVTLVLLPCILRPFCAAQASCTGRCGEPYTTHKKGQVCNCDYDCLSHNECCGDFELMCTTGDSCKGRCGETFQRARQCDCDSDCVLYKTCCPDRQTRCTEEKTTRPPRTTMPVITRKDTSHTDSERNKPKGADQQIAAPVSGVNSDPMQAGARGTPLSDKQGLPSEKPATLPVSLILSPARPSTLTDVSQAPLAHSADSLAGDRNDTSLCSGRPIDGMTTLRNGTIVVFRGHFFWILDSSGAPGPAGSIREAWGIPSPIDTVFSRCNCQGKTFFIKDSNYWRFENGVMDPGYPKTIFVGFHGLSGSITAALSMPANRRRPESVYFFKKGGLVQRYTYLLGGSTTCSNSATPLGNRVTPRGYSARNHLRRRSENRLGKEIKLIKLTWKGFPSLVTAAVSIPAPKKLEGYRYYIFSGGKYYSLNLDEEALSLTATSYEDYARSWFKCP